MTEDQASQGAIARRMEAKLRAAFSPAILQILDESAAHAGHAGARPGGETHFRIVMSAEAFSGLSRLARQRAVHDVLREELADRVHALSLSLGAPED